MCRLPHFKVYIHEALRVIIPKAHQQNNLSPSERWSWTKNVLKTLCIHILEKWKQYKYSMELKEELYLLQVDNLFWNNVTNPDVYDLWIRTREQKEMESIRRLQDEAETRRLHDFDLNESPTAYFHDKGKIKNTSRVITPPESIHSVNDFLELAKNHFSADSINGVFRKSNNIDREAQNTLFAACTNFRISNVHSREAENDFILSDIEEALRKTEGGKTDGFPIVMVQMLAMANHLGNQHELNKMEGQLN
jgi:hypothetical protein